MKPSDKILVATDFSAHATGALKFAAGLARATGAPLTVAHVYDVIPYALPEGMPAYGLVDLDRLRVEFQKGLDTAKITAQEAGATKVETVLLQGVPYMEIARFAEQQGFALIVMGTHGRTGIAHLLLGSVAERVVRKASCPVITVPSRENVAKAS